jgi:hypothetical protein
MLTDCRHPGIVPMDESQDRRDYSVVTFPGPKNARICTIRPAASKRNVSMGRKVERLPW